MSTEAIATRIANGVVAAVLAALVPFAAWSYGIGWFEIFDRFGVSVFVIAAALGFAVGFIFGDQALAMLKRSLHFPD